MKRFAILRLATVVGVALLTGTFAIAQGIAPPPTNPRPVGEPIRGKASRVPAERVPGSFVIQWDPAMINATTPYPTYLLSHQPKVCKFVNTATLGQFQQKSFTAPPYQVKVECVCNYPVIVWIATFSGVVGVKNSGWIKAPEVKIPCE
jgi:hypothetical protein